MDDVDKKILNIIQHDFPLTPSPYEEIGRSVGIREEELIHRLQNMMDNNIIRQIGPVFSAHHLGYRTTLAAMEVPEDKLEETVNVLNSYHEITHNYGREHRYNVWFTLICPSQEEVERIVEEIKAKTGIKKIFNLPYSKLFKIKVKFSY